MEYSPTGRAVLSISTDVPGSRVLQKHEASRWNAKLPIANLPPELLGRVFSFLSANRQDIATCRQVCTIFREHATRFLITYITFAHRPDVAAHLDSVMKHEYFRKHVTDFVFDASLYDPRLANDWETYVDACTNSGRLLYDSEWLRNESKLRLLWNKLETYSNYSSAAVNPTSVPSQAVQEANLEALDRVFDTLRSSVHDGEHAHESAMTDLRAALVSSGPSQVGPETRRDSSDVEQVDGQTDTDEEETESQYYFDRIYGMGCHKGFPAYHMAHRVQKDFQRAGLPSNMLAHVFSRFPKLRRVVFTDFRQHALEEDGYDDCCRRRFGHVTLEPQHLCQCEETWGGFHLLVNAIATAPSTSIKSLSVGSSTLEYCTGSCLCGVATQQPARVPRALPLNLFDELGELGWRNTRKVFADLRQLELDFSIQAKMRKELDKPHSESLLAGLATFGKLLSACTTNLTLLELGTARLTQHDRANSDYHVPRQGSHSVFSTLLAPLRFQQLQHLDLRGWVLSSAELQQFLSAHSSSLKTVRLLYNVLVGDSLDLARWASNHLQLRGIELRNWPDASPSAMGTEAQHLQKMAQDITHDEMESIWLAGRPNDLDHISATKTLNVLDEDSTEERERMRTRMRTAGAT